MTTVEDQAVANQATSDADIQAAIEAVYQAISQATIDAIGPMAISDVKLDDRVVATFAKLDKQCGVYILRITIGDAVLYKFGRSRNLRERLCRHQRTFSSMTLICALQCGSFNASVAVEAAFARALNAFGIWHTHKDGDHYYQELFTIDNVDIAVKLLTVLVEMSTYVDAMRERARLAYEESRAGAPADEFPRVCGTNAEIDRISDIKPGMACLEDSLATIDDAHRADRIANQVDINASVFECPTTFAQYLTTLTEADDHVADRAPPDGDPCG